MNLIFIEENLLVFIIVVCFGSFSKVVEELGLIIFVISYIIKCMEMGLDVVLFICSICSIELMEFGCYFFCKVIDLLNDFYVIKCSIDIILQGIEVCVCICINQLFYMFKYIVCLLQVLKKQFFICQIIVIIEVYNGVWDVIINNQVNIVIGVFDILLDGGGIDYIEIGVICWVFVIVLDYLLVFVLEFIVES